MIDLNYLTTRAQKLSDTRINNGARIEKDLLKAAATEIVEAVQAKDLFQTYSDCTEEVGKQLKARLADELADIVFCILVECANSNIDIEKAIRANFKKNENRALLIGDKK